MSLLEQITSPDDVRKLNIEQLKGLADELRGQILEVTTKNGGHLSSNLGIVETTLALYHNFDFSNDKLIFDVGHQCYAHKILSDRRDNFNSIRLDGGISGFPDIFESKFDAFGAGHAGTSISAGLGYCTARDKKGENYYVIVIVGDGALANGLNLEALSSTNSKPAKLIVILNDNGMSISKNKNGFYKFISKRTTQRAYIRYKRGVRKVFGQSFVTRALGGVKNFLKRIIKKNDYFENHGFKYVGVVDGNNMKEVDKIISGVKYASNDKAVFLHIKTTKGKGYNEAEEHADLYHGVGTNLKNEAGEFSRALGEQLVSMIDEDKRIVAITAGMKDGTGLKKVEEVHGNNFVDVGIAESFAVTYASGMAAGGLKPIVAIYSTFLQRAYDQVLHDVCLQNLPVVFCLDRSGLVGKDGKTHQGVFDLSFLTHIPNLTIIAPATVEDLKCALPYAMNLKSPVVIRYPKNSIMSRKGLPFENCLWERIKEGNKATILAVGPRMVDLAERFANITEGVGVISARTIKPLCQKTLDEIKDTVIITLEENSVIGGFGALVNNYYLQNNQKVKIANLGVKDKFVCHGEISNQLKANGLTVENLQKTLEGMLGI